MEEPPPTPPFLAGVERGVRLLDALIHQIQTRLKAFIRFELALGYIISLPALPEVTREVVVADPLLCGATIEIGMKSILACI